MKRCPFCAEEIQDEAIKCKHCGEWLTPKETSSAEVSDSRKESIEEVPDTTDEIKQQEEETEIIKSDTGGFIEKERIKNGWGWIVVVGIYLWGISGLKTNYTDPTFEGLNTFVQLTGLIITPLMYLRIRRRLWNKKKSRPIPNTSIKAGLITYLIMSVIVGFSMGILSRLDMNSYGKQYDQMEDYLRKELVRMNGEEERLWNIYSESPRSQSDLTILNDILGLIENKEKISNKYIDAYEKFVIHANNEQLSKKYSRIRPTITYYYSTYRKAIDLLKETYLTPNNALLQDEANKFLDQANTIWQEAVNLIADFQETVDNLK